MGQPALPSSCTPYPVPGTRYPVPGTRYPASLVALTPMGFLLHLVIVAAALWPSIALVVPGTVVGTANGIATSVQMLGVGICNLATGAIVDAAGYPALMKMFLGFACVATLGGETARSSLSRARKHSPACPAISVTLMDKDGKLKESKKEREHRTTHSSSAALRCVFSASKLICPALSHPAFTV